MPLDKGSEPAEQPIAKGPVQADSRAKSSNESSSSEDADEK